MIKDLAQLRALQHRLKANAEAAAKAERERREQERRAHGEALFNDLWRTVPQGKGK